MEKFDTIIIGAGLTGLCVAHFLKKKDPEMSVCILEKSSRLGGAIQSVREQGFLAEWGAHGFLDNVPESRELLDDLDTDGRIQKAPLKQFVRYICLNGQLVMIPQSPPKIIKSNLLPLPAKMRVLADLWKKPKPNEQTIADWAAYRFGKKILPFADIALTGTYAGDINKLSIDAAMPGLRGFEQKYGSVLKGAIKNQRKGSQRGLPSMVSFKGGMEELITLLAKDKKVKLNSEVQAIDRDEKGWSIKSSEKQYYSESLVVATQVNKAIPMLSKLQEPPLLSINEALVINIVMGFGENAKIPFGFGYLAPKTENRFALGTLFSMHMFEGRAPVGLKIVEVLVGGTRNPEYLSLEDEQLIDRAYKDIRQLLQLPSPPIFTKVLRPVSGIPQLELGHKRLIDYRNQLRTSFPRLHITGFGWEGIGINDMIKSAKQTAESVLQKKTLPDKDAEAKGVYF